MLSRVLSLVALITVLGGPSLAIADSSVQMHSFSTEISNLQPTSDGMFLSQAAANLQALLDQGWAIQTVAEPDVNRPNVPDAVFLLQRSTDISQRKNLKIRGFEIGSSDIVPGETSKDLTSDDWQKVMKLIADGWSLRGAVHFEKRKTLVLILQRPQ